MYLFIDQSTNMYIYVHVYIYIYVCAYIYIYIGFRHKQSETKCDDHLYTTYIDSYMYGDARGSLSALISI